MLNRVIFWTLSCNNKTKRIPRISLLTFSWLLFVKWFDETGIDVLTELNLRNLIVPRKVLVALVNINNSRLIKRCHIWINIAFLAFFHKFFGAMPIENLVKCLKFMITITSVFDYWIQRLLFLKFNNFLIILACQYISICSI